MRPKAVLLKLLKWFADRLLGTMLSLGVAALIAAWGGFYSFSMSLLDYPIQLLNMPTPLWATIALVLLSGVCVHIKTARSHSSFSPKIKTGFIEVGKFKWKTTISSDNYHVDPYPYCVQHDMRMVEDQETYKCPYHDGNSLCQNTLSKEANNQLLKIAFSKTEQLFRNKK